MKKIALLPVLLICCLLLAAQNQMPDPYPKTISVTGSAEMDIIPDEIYVQVSSKNTGKKMKKSELKQSKRIS